MKKFLRVFCVAFVVFIQGCFCVSQRYYTIPKVADIGPGVATRFKYRIVCAYEGDTAKLKDMKTEFFQKYQPQVFSENASDAIPVIIRVPLLGKSRYSNNQWSYLFYWTCIIPIWMEEETIFPFSMEFADESSGRIAFEIASGSDALSILMNPFAFCFYDGAPDSDGCKVFCGTSKDVSSQPGMGGPEMTYPYLDSLHQEALAYAVAVKLKELEDTGKVAAMLGKEAVSRSSAPAHNIIRLDRDSVKSFSYSFEIELAQTPSDMKAALRAVLEEFMKALKEDYLDSVPGTDDKTLRIAFFGLKRNGLRISGSAAALTIKPISLEYDANMRRGKLAIRFNAGQETEAREWIKRNIKTLARDQNIAIKSGQLPSDAACHFVSEEIVSNVMTVEFKVQ